MMALSPEAQRIFEEACKLGAMPPHSKPYFDMEEVADRWAAEQAWQATLKPWDHRHDKMFVVESMDGVDWITIYWGGYPYEYDMSRLHSPEEVLWFLLHIAEKEWKHVNGQRVGGFIEAVCKSRGWKAYHRVPHPNEAPPAFHDAKAEREKLTPALRYSVIRRDGSRCRCCGASVATGAVLHVDHIIPVAKGGRTTESNLQTLCAVCNQGKAAS